MSTLTNNPHDQLVWATQLFDDPEGNTWSLHGAKVNTLIKTKPGQMKGVNESGDLIVIHLKDNKVVKQPTIIRGEHCKKTLIKHFDWVPYGLENIQRRMWGVLNFIKEPALRDFYYSVLTNDELMEQFYTAKGSHHNHHNYEGGLLEHSFEVAYSAASLGILYKLDHVTVCISFIAGLLHDIGKIETYYNRSRSKGVCVQHEALSFMVLSEPLNALLKAAPKMFEALSSSLTAKVGRHKPLYLPESLVRLCDNLSAEISQCRKAFAGMPDYFWYAKSDQDNRVYKRLGSM